MAFFSSHPKRPPPKDGIKVKKSGTTWWGQRWIAALERLSASYSNRLARGRTYARAGRTHDLKVESGIVTAKVTGSRVAPYEVTLRLKNLSDEAWQAAISAISERAQFAAELLAGSMPKHIEEAFQKSGASLFPGDEADLVTECSCPDWANPCKHVAAAHYVLGESLDRDPFLLFELRGRKKPQVLMALRQARAGDFARTMDRDGEPVADDGDLAIRSVRLDVSNETYDRPRQPLEALKLSFDRPGAQAAVLRQLGVPAGWRSQDSPTELLAPLIQAAAARARRIALGEASMDADENDVAPAPVVRTPNAPKALEPQPEVFGPETARKAALKRPAPKAAQPRKRRPR